jgi:hypothetical protein
MGFLVKLVLFGHVVAVAIFSGVLWAVLTDRLPPMPPMPELEKKWFGPGSRVKEDESVRPFKIDVDNKVGNFNK